MGTTDVLSRSIQHTHETLTVRLDLARAMGAPAAEPHLDQQRIDVFLATASKHLHAVDAVLLPPARRRVRDGSHLVHDYLRSAKGLEVVLAHVKAHEYGSVYETSFAWPAVWDDVRTAMTDHRRHEEVLGEKITAALDDEIVDRLAQRLQDAELAAPSRPHPYTPHTGLLGLVSRKVMHTADRFWDHVEGRWVPEQEHAPKKRPGLVAQYFLADPRFDEEEERPTS